MADGCWVSHHARMFSTKHSHAQTVIHREFPQANKDPKRGTLGVCGGGEMKKENPPGGTMNFPAAALLLLLSSVSVSVSVRLPRRLEVGRYVVVVVVSAANVCVFSLSLSLALLLSLSRVVALTL